MATIDVSDIQVYKSGGWRTLRDKSIFKNGAWKNFGTGSGIYKNGNWYVLKSSGTTQPPTEPVPTTNKITIQRVFLNNKYQFNVQSQKPLDSYVTLYVTVAKADGTGQKSFNINLPYKSYDSYYDDTVLDSTEKFYYIKSISVSPTSDKTYKYEPNNAVGSRI